MSKNQLVYDVNDRPPFGKMLVFAFQQVLAIMAATIAVPTIIGLPTQIPAAILGAGVGTIVYLLFTKFKSPVFLGSSFAFLSSLGAGCVVLYLVFTLTTPYYIGYALLVVYWVWGIRRYYRHKPSHLLCGMCRRSIPQKGRCPHCGAWNE